MNNIYTQGAILLLSGPSGCGKSSLLKEVYKEIENYYFSISTTTRQPRAGEMHGRDYFFVSKEVFEKGIEENDFLEWAEVHGNYYGTSLQPIYAALDEKKLVIFDIDVQGFEQVMQKLASITTTVFITTPSIQELKNRLYKRDTDTKEVIEKRILNAKKEIEYLDKYDYCIINDDLASASKELVSIARSALRKSSLFDTKTLINTWYS